MGMKKINILYFLFILIIFGVFHLVRIEAQQGFQMTNLHCTNIKVTYDTQGVHGEARCEGKYTLTGTPPTPDYNVNLKLKKSFEYNGTQLDGTQTVLHALNQFGQVIIIVDDLPAKQDVDMLYTVKVSLDDHIGPEYNAGSFSFTIPKKVTPSSTGTSGTGSIGGNTSPGSSSTKSSKVKFAGLEVTKTKAQPIEDKEKEGYTCIVTGQTFEGKVKSPKRAPTSWFIPAENTAPSKGNPTVGKNIILSYSFKTPITCIRVEPPDVAIVNLDTVTKWNVPKK